MTDIVYFYLCTFVHSADIKSHGNVVGWWLVGWLVGWLVYIAVKQMDVVAA